MTVEFIGDKMRVKAFIWVPNKHDPKRKRLWGHEDVDISKSALNKMKPKLEDIHGAPGAWGHTFEADNRCGHCWTAFNDHQAKPAICPQWRKNTLNYLNLRASRRIHRKLHEQVK